MLRFERSRAKLGPSRLRRAGGLLLTAAVLACGDAEGAGVVTLRFWAMGREGEVVGELVKEFERTHPGIRVRVQQIPWTAAHEKLLTAHVGEATPDVAQLGNTWVPEFVALDALEPLGARVGASSAVAPNDYFEGIWATNEVHDTLYGVPWYVDTRVLFYRADLLRAAGYDSIPTTWAGWREAMVAVKARQGPRAYPILLPTNEWPQPVILGLQAGGSLLRDGGQYGAFSDSTFRRGFEFYAGLFRDGLAPVQSASEIANRYQEFERGNIAMVITGPWEIGEFSRRLPATLQDAWRTAPLPGPDGAGVSLAGGASLVVFRRAEHKTEAWQLIEFLSRPDVQLRFYQLTGNLPPRRTAWRDSVLTTNQHARAFRDQLERVRPLPAVPEIEEIVLRVAEAGDRVARRQQSIVDALARLDREVDRLLEKRRWMLARQSEAPAGTGGGR